MRIEFENGKYAAGFDEHNRMFFERYNEPWEAMDHLIHSKFLRLLVEECGRLRAFEREIKEALRRKETKPLEEL